MVIEKIIRANISGTGDTMFLPLEGTKRLSGIHYIKQQTQEEDRRLDQLSMFEE